MKYYIQFYENKTEAISSDGYCPLDGRLSIANMAHEARIQMYRLRRVQSYNGFKIMRGNLRCASVIYTELANEN